MTDILPDTTSRDHRSERVRHPLKFRLLSVTRVARTTPSMIRVTLTGDDLAGFASAGFDDHVKLFFPDEGQEVPTLPGVGANGAPVFEGERPLMRDYTPRRYDATTNELDIEFAIHEAGPATRWAMQATAGQKIGVGGPRGSFVLAGDFDWYLMIGDDAALPAIARRLEELHAGARAIVIADVGSVADEQRLETRASASITWVHRGAAAAGTPERLEAALRALALPDGDGHAWIAAESDVAKRLRRILVEEKRHPKAWVRASGYWRHGAEGAHETIED